jgi:hypothetical protein
MVNFQQLLSSYVTKDSKTAKVQSNLVNLRINLGLRISALEGRKASLLGNAKIEANRKKEEFFKNFRNEFFQSSDAERVVGAFANYKLAEEGLDDQLAAKIAEIDETIALVKQIQDLIPEDPSSITIGEQQG